MKQKITGKKIIVIGGGIGGLSVGCYLQMNGFETTVLEKNINCGGVTVSWKRNGYVFDGATNWLAGSSPSANMHELLRELINFKEITCIDPDEFIVVEQDDKKLHVYCDADKLCNEMKRIAPEDRKIIEEFTNAIKKVGTFSLPYQKAPELFNIFDYVSMVFTQLPFLSFFLKWKKITIGQFARRFSNPVLRNLFLGIFPHHHHFSIFSILMTLGWMNIKSGGYPLGGSAKFIELIEKKYRDLGGKIFAGTEVESILTGKRSAVGVKTSDGKTYKADTVVSAIDMHYTLNELLKRESISGKFKAKYQSLPVFPSLIQVSVGCKRIFPGIAHKIQMSLETPLNIDGVEKLSDMMVRVCNFDPAFSAQGTTSIVVHFRTENYDYWKDLRNSDYSKYKNRKEQIARAVIDTLDKRFGDVKKTLEITDVATPATYIRYTNIFKGSYQGWAPAPECIGKTLPRKIKNLKKFYFAGQWIWPAGGLPGVIRIGRQTAQIICKESGVKFKVNNRQD